MKSYQQWINLKISFCFILFLYPGVNVITLKMKIWHVFLKFWKKNNRIQVRNTKWINWLWMKIKLFSNITNAWHTCFYFIFRLLSCVCVKHGKNIIKYATLVTQNIMLFFLIPFIYIFSHVFTRYNAFKAQYSPKIIFIRRINSLNRNYVFWLLLTQMHNKCSVSSQSEWNVKKKLC